jgi:hypothetical protein
MQGREFPMQTKPLNEGSKPTETPRRKRGAQPGNLNHLKHGLYLYNFSPEELKRYARSDKDLAAELAAARLMADRLITRLTRFGL